MPEGPEVQTVVSTLEKQIKGNSIIGIQITYPRIIENEDKQFFIDHLIGNQFVDFKRHGKFLILQLRKGYLIVHLRMEGKFFIDTNDDLDKHTHVIFELNDGRFLKYHDVRKFGRLTYVDELTIHPGLNKLGLDVLDSKLTKSVLFNRLKNRTIPIKQALLDQSIVSGIGNIYANEICFDAKIHPITPCYELSSYQVDKILKSSKKIIKEAIAMGGTAIRSYTSSLNVHGLFDQKLMVHQQSQCKLCLSDIEKIFINKRGTYFCPKCQKRKKSPSQAQSLQENHQS